MSLMEPQPSPLPQQDPEPMPAPDRAPRHDRGQPGRRGIRLTLGLKVGLLMALLLGVLVSSSAVLIAENRSTARAYEQILDRQVRQGLIARQLQVEFKKRVQEWKDILLRGADPADLKLYSGRFERQDATIHTLYQQLVDSEPDPALKAQLQKFAAMERDVDEAYDRAYEAFVASGGKDVTGTDRSVRGIDRPLTDHLDRIVAGREALIGQDVASQRQLVDHRQRLTLLVTAALVALLAGGLALAVVRIVRPLRALVRQADLAAHEHLPAAVERLRRLRTTDELPTLPRFDARTSDEVADLADALTALQDSALEQAVAQHRADRETAGMLVNLGRRNQNLLGRMLSYVTELERQEEDPDVLAQLFRLDHATTRIRRNAESMLVLAGAGQTRTWSRPVPVVDVVRAALSEIEEYVRVELHHLEDALVNGSAVADVVHLVAELIENATHFSPPTTRVTVVGQRAGEGYRLRIIDEGVGMTHRELEHANLRINDARGGWTDSKLLGLYVVGRLARRRSVEVSLEPSAGRGITASILLPPSVLTATTSTTSTTSPKVPTAATATAPTTPTTATGTTPVDSGESAAAAKFAEQVPAVESAEQVPALESAEPAAGTEPAAPTLFEPAVPVLVSVPSAVDAAADEPAPVDLPRPTLPAGLGGSARLGATGDEDRTIDLTDSSGAGGRGSLSAGGVPVQWFDRRWGRTGDPEPARRADQAATTAGQAANTGTGPLEDPGAAPAVPRRVRGAQLPDLGPAAEPTIARPEDGPGAAESLRWQLRSFQLDVQAARRAISESEPAADDPDHGHHHPEGE